MILVLEIFLDIWSWTENGEIVGLIVQRVNNI